VFLDSLNEIKRELMWKPIGVDIGNSLERSISICSVDSTKM